MDIKITAPSALRGDILLPSSKSISNRVLLLNKLAGSKLLPSNIAVCDDSDAMQRALSSTDVEIDTGAAGTATRFSLAYLSMTEGEHILTGSPRMKQRPISILVDALRKMGAEIEYLEKEGYLPLKIEGKKLKGGELELNGGVSSQYVSALLMIAPYTENGLDLKLTGEIISMPYIKMTLALMGMYGVLAAFKDNTIRVPVGKYNPISYRVEGDWSAASYWYGFASLATECDVICEGLDSESIQGDSRVSTIFSSFGVASVFNDGYVTLQKCNFTKKTYEVNLSNTPDLAQTIVVVAALNGVNFKLSGLQSLRIKETDRISALVTEMRKLGFVLDDSEEGTLSWQGEMTEPQKEIIINTYDDHRMAMSFAIASYKYPQIKVKNAEVVTKSYPDFWEHLLNVGFSIEEC